MGRIRELLSCTAEAVLGVDRDQNIVNWNEAAEQLLGWDRRDVLGRPCAEVLGGYDAAGCPICQHDCLAMRRAVEGKTEPTRDMHALHRDGQRIWLSVSTIRVPAEWRESAMLIHLVRDIGRRKCIEEALRRLLETISSSETDCEAQAQDTGQPLVNA